MSAAEQKQLRLLLQKILRLAGGSWFLLTFVFGITVCKDDGMRPAIGAGDAVLFNRLRFPRPGEIAVVRCRGRTVTARVVAAAGDEVDIAEPGLLINGARQQEPLIPEATYRLESDIDFPLKVATGRVFLLGDHRGSAWDSRIFGSADRHQLQGTVIAVLRTRGI